MVETSTFTEKQNKTATTTADIVVEVTRPTDGSAGVKATVEMNQGETSPALVDLIDKSPLEKGKAKRRLTGGLSAGGLTRLIKEGSKWFPTTDGELLFTLSSKTMTSREFCRLTRVYAPRMFLTVYE